MSENTRFRVYGVAAMQEKLAALIAAARPAMQRALATVAADDLAEAKQLVPVATGNLRDSGVVLPPARQGPFIRIAVTFGNSSVNYAMQVHEDLEAFHRHGQAKFLETVLHKLERHFAARVGADIKRDLKT